MMLWVTVALGGPVTAGAEFAHELVLKDLQPAGERAEGAGLEVRVRTIGADSLGVDSQALGGKRLHRAQIVLLDPCR